MIYLIDSLIGLLLIGMFIQMMAYRAAAEEYVEARIIMDEIVEDLREGLESHEGLTDQEGRLVEVGLKIAANIIESRLKDPENYKDYIYQVNEE